MNPPIVFKLLIIVKSLFYTCCRSTNQILYAAYVIPAAFEI